MRVIGKRRQRTTTTTRFGAGATRAAALAVALATADTAAADSGAGFDREHTAWTSLVRRYVSDGLVDYAALKRDGRPSLDAYLRSTPVAISWSPPPYPIAQARLDKSGRLVDAWYAVPAVRRAKQILPIALARSDGDHGHRTSPRPPRHSLTANEPSYVPTARS